MIDTPKNDNNFTDQKSLNALKLHGEKIIYAVLWYWLSFWLAVLSKIMPR